MANFKENTFSPVYPESNDKRGEVQIVKIQGAPEVGQNYTETMRLDYLPVFSNPDNGSISQMAPGRQTMYRSVRAVDWNLPWAVNTPDLVESFILPGGVNVAENLSFQDFISENTRAYQDTLNYMLNAAGLSTISVMINEVHVIGSNITMNQKGNEHVFFQTYDCIFYGQQTPNPFVAPTPTCEILPDYEFRVAYPISDPTKGLASVDPGAKNFAQIELFPKGGGTGVNFSTACVFGFDILPDVNIGSYYCIKVEYTALLAGTTLPLTIKPQYQNIGTVTLNDTGNAVYLIAQRLAGALTIRVETAAQTPSAGENSPIITLSLYTPECFS